MKNIFRLVRLDGFLFMFLCLFIPKNPLYAQWVHTSGPNGTNVSCLIFNKGNLLAGTSGGGIFISMDNGSSWAQSNEGLTNSSLVTLFVNGTDIYAGSNWGLYKSTNNGSSWNYITGTNFCVRALAVNGTHLFAGSDGGTIYTSTDNGSNWTQVGSVMTGPQAQPVFALTISDSSIFAGTSGNGIFRSIDSGKTWIPINTGLTSLGVGSMAVNNGIIFAGTGDGVSISTNNGSSWTQRNTGLQNNGVMVLFGNGTKVYAVTYGGGIFVTTDNGLSWNPLNSGLTDMNINAIAIDSSKIFVGTSTGVFLSINNGSNWTDVSKGLAYGLDVYALGARGNYIFAAGGSGGVFRSSDNGTSWTAVNSGMYNGYVNYMAVYDTTIFVDAGQGSFYTSTNDGTNWNYYSYTNDLLSTLGFVVHSTTKGTSIFVGSNGGLFRSTDNCTSWTRVGFMDTTIRGFAFSDTNFFAGTAVGAFLSTNNGASWTEIGLKNIYVGAFVVSPNDTGGTNIIAGTSNGIYLSSNNGTNWVQVKSGINIASLAFSGKNIFASTWSDGIFLSTNNGATWAAFNTGLTNDPNCVPALAVSGTNIYAGVTNGGGVWRRPLSETVSVDKLSTDLPTHFSLDQNYPNPFNPATTISFTLPSKSFVSLKVFDILGREVATIISEEMSAGSYSRQWNAANMSSGIYFYRLQAGTFIETKKLVLLR